MQQVHNIFNIFFQNVKIITLIFVTYNFLFYFTKINKRA